MKQKLKLTPFIMTTAMTTASLFAGMACGAGKCGASMMTKDTKPKTKTLTEDENASMVIKNGKMACGAGKCGTSHPKKETDPDWDF